MEASISKVLIRKVTYQYRKLLEESEFEKRNQSLLENILSFIMENRIQSIHTFLSIKKNREPDISPILIKLMGQGINIIVSKTNFQEKTMSHFYLKEDTVLTMNHLGIPEPIGQLAPANINNVDVIFVPLLASDKSGNRIGYGGGYYDQILSDTKALKVGLSLSPSLDKIIQKDDWDVPLDKIIYPNQPY